MQVCDQVLGRIPAAQQEARMTYSHGDHLYHHVTRDGIIALAIAEAATDRATVFTFLERILDKVWCYSRSGVRWNISILIMCLPVQPAVRGPRSHRHGVRHEHGVQSSDCIGDEED